MGVIGSALGGAIGIGSAIFGGISASRAMKQVKANIEKQRLENQNRYDRRINEDATQRAWAQRMLTLVGEDIKKRNRQAAATAAVMGGTEESMAAAREANNGAMAEAASQIAAAGERRKDQIEDQYIQADNSLTTQLNNMEMQKASAIGTAVGGAAQAAAGMGEYF